MWKDKAAVRDAADIILRLRFIIVLKLMLLQGLLELTLCINMLYICYA